MIELRYRNAVSSDFGSLARLCGLLSDRNADVLLSNLARLESTSSKLLFVVVESDDEGIVGAMFAHRDLQVGPAIFVHPAWHETEIEAGLTAIYEAEFGAPDRAVGA